MANDKQLRFLGRCSDVDQDTWNLYMSHARPVSPERLVKQIKRDCPELTDELYLYYPVSMNPYASQSVKTWFIDPKTLEKRTLKVYVNSMVEYFFEEV